MTFPPDHPAAPLRRRADAARAEVRAHALGVARSLAGAREAGGRRSDAVAELVAQRAALREAAGRAGELARRLGEGRDAAAAALHAELRGEGDGDAALAADDAVRWFLEAYDAAASGASEGLLSGRTPPDPPPAVSA